MAQQTARGPLKWKVLRRFEGEKSPEELLRALIQAHKA